MSMTIITKLPLSKKKKECHKVYYRGLYQEGSEDDVTTTPIVMSVEKAIQYVEKQGETCLAVLKFEYI